MIKAIINFCKHLHDKEIDYHFELEFSIYDVLALVIIGIVLIQFL